jgi:hypothetical protein
LYAEAIVKPVGAFGEGVVLERRYLHMGRTYIKIQDATRAIRDKITPRD